MVSQQFFYIPGVKPRQKKKEKKKEKKLTSSSQIGPPPRRLGSQLLGSLRHTEPYRRGGARLLGHEGLRGRLHSTTNTTSTTHVPKPSSLRLHLLHATAHAHLAHAHSRALRLKRLGQPRHLRLLLLRLEAAHKTRGLDLHGGHACRLGHERALELLWLLLRLHAGHHGHHRLLLLLHRGVLLLEAGLGEVIQALARGSDLSVARHLGLERRRGEGTGLGGLRCGEGPRGRRGRH